MSEYNIGDLLSNNPIGILNSAVLESAEPLKLVKTRLDELITINKTQFNNKTVLDEVAIEGLDANQVWWQAKIVLDKIEPNLMDQILELKDVLKQQVSDDESEEEENDDGDDKEEEEQLPEESVSSDDESEYMTAENIQPEDSELEEELNEQDIQGKWSEADDQEPEEVEEDIEVEEGEDDDEEEEEGEEEPEFFDPEEFNKKMELAEEKGEDIFGGNNDDDEEVDYFGDVSSDEDEEAMYYNDFFDKPSFQKKNKNAKKPKSTKKQEKNSDESDLDDEAYDRAMDAAKLDLFADEEGDSDEDDNENHAEGRPLSTFERQQLEIQRQIEQLEEEAVAEKKWAMKGEVKARDRPQDALITEDLEFDRAAKPIPVITAEVTESLEDMIRKRIREGNFDDLARRLVTDLPKFRSKAKFELSDTKSSKSLAEEYQEDYQNSLANQGDEEISEELQKSHDEISDMFSNLMYKLDALSSAHFVPKPQSKSLEVKVQTAAITMEDAQPLTMSSASTLAPQEVYKVGKSENSDEITLKNGTIMAKEELSREDKQRLRRSIKRKRSKAFNSRQESKQATNTKKSKTQDVIETLASAKNITVIDKKGQKSDIRGNVQKTVNKTTNDFKL